MDWEGGGIWGGRKNGMETEIRMGADGDRDMDVL